MDWKQGRRSSNVEDARGSGGRRIGGGLGIGGVAVVIVLGLLTGHSPMEMLNILAGSSGPGTTQTQAPPANDESADFVRAILGETEDVWSAQFQAMDRQYEAPRLVLFSGEVQSGCGGATSATGPFYCPADQRVYLDMSFFAEMERSLGGGGDFADAYVIAHEVGHHLQTLFGTAERVAQAESRGKTSEGAAGLSVRTELQADCYAGVWAYHAQQHLHWLENGDVDEAMRTASAIGDDRLQQQGQGRVVPDSFTHGTSAQRTRWFKRGFENGEIGNCNTFKVEKL